MSPPSSGCSIPCSSAQRRRNRSSLSCSASIDTGPASIAPTAPASRTSLGTGYRLPFCLPWIWKSGDDANLSRLGKPHHSRELAQLKPTRHRGVKKPSTRGSVPRHCKKEKNWLNRLSSSRAVTIRAPWRYDLRRRDKTHGGRVTCHPTGQALLLLGAGEICGKRIKAERVHAMNNAYPFSRVGAVRLTTRRGTSPRRAVLPSAHDDPAPERQSGRSTFYRGACQA
jgi:hypothetical protein